MMNIVFVSLKSPVSYLGGAEILTFVLAESLVNLGHRVTIYTAGNGLRRVLRGVTIQEVRLFRLPLRFRTTLLPLYSFILRFFFYFNKDFRNASIVHAVDSSAIMLLAGWQFLEKKLVATIQDYTLIWPKKDYFSYGSEKKRDRSVVTAFAERIRQRNSYAALQKLTHVICVSDYVAKRYREVNDRTIISVIGNGVSSGWKMPRAIHKRDIDILYVGKLMPYKGLDILLDALPLLPKPSRVSVVIVGEGLHERYKKQLQKLRISHEVRFTGPIPYQDIPDFYQRSKIVISPSIWPEPCGRSIIEAMWMGCAVVATSVGGTPESLVDTLHGYLIPPHDPKAIARATGYLLAHPDIRDRVGRQAASYARKNYSARRIARKYVKFYGLIKSQRLVI